MRLLADVREITSNQIEFPLDDQQVGDPTWGSEVTPTPSASTPQIGLVNVLAHQQACYVDVTQTMLDDMPDVDTWLLSKLDDKFRRDENTKFVIGDGADKPKGFLSYAAWDVPSTIGGTTGVYQRNAVEQIDSGTPGEITADGIRTIQGALKEEYQEGAVFVMKRMTWNDVSLLKDGIGRYLIDPNLLKVSTTLEMLNRPVVFGNDMPAVASGSLPIAYGDFKRGYQIVDRLGMRVLRNPYIQHPLVRFQAFRRTGGVVKNFESIKLLKCSAS
jgi:HK97 family phage major capsid protein